MFQMIKAILLGAAALVAAPALAQTYPTKPVRMVITYPAGGSIDLAGRRLAEALGPELGQQVIVDNRPGANGVIGSETVVRAAPDGHTLLFQTVVAHTSNPALNKSLPYDSVKDFTPVTIINAIPLVLVAHPSFPAKNVRDLVRLAKEQPGQITYASAGHGSANHLAAAQLVTMAGLNVLHVPYKGGAPAIADVLGGHVHLFVSGLNSVLPHIQSGKLRALAVTGRTRAKVLPNVPAVAETAGLKEYESTVSPAVWVPARTPPEIVTRLHGAIAKVIRTPEYRQKLERDGEGEPIGSTPEQTAATIKREIDLYARMVKAGALKVD